MKFGGSGESLEYSRWRLKMRMKEVERERTFSLFSLSAVVNAAGQTRKSRFFSSKMSMDRKLWEMPVCAGADLKQFLYNFEILTWY